MTDETKSERCCYSAMCDACWALPPEEYAERVREAEAAREVRSLADIIRDMARMAETP
jgi:hypothetical protein